MSGDHFLDQINEAPKAITLPLLGYTPTFTILLVCYQWPTPGRRGVSAGKMSLKSLLIRVKGIFTVLTTKRPLCFKALVCSLKVWLISAAGALLVLRLISESCVSIHSAAPVSSITSMKPLHPSLPTPNPPCTHQTSLYLLLSSLLYWPGAWVQQSPMN